MEITQLQYFLTLASMEHVSEAAGILGISQPALSRSIASLERNLGVRLFDRRGNHIYLNDYGRNFMHYAQNCIDSLNSGIISVQQSMYDIVGSIQIICYAFVGALEDSIVEYARLNPKTKLCIYQRGHEAPSAARQHDFYFLSINPKLTDLDTDNWVSQPVMAESVRLVISPKYRAFPEEVTGLDLADLKEEQFIGMPLDNSFAKDITYSLCHSSGFAPKIFCSTEDFLTKVRLVDAGLAIAFLPECCLPTVRKLSPETRSFSILNHDTTRTLYLMRRRKAQMTEAAIDFWNFAMDFYNVTDPKAKV